jgi:hypothetical protein
MFEYRHDVHEHLPRKNPFDSEQPVSERKQMMITIFTVIHALALCKSVVMMTTFVREL